MSVRVIAALLPVVLLGCDPQVDGKFNGGGVTVEGLLVGLTEPAPVELRPVWQVTPTPFAEIPTFRFVDGQERVVAQGNEFSLTVVTPPPPELWMRDMQGSQFGVALIASLDTSRASNVGDIITNGAQAAVGTAEDLVILYVVDQFAPESRAAMTFGPVEPGFHLLSGSYEILRVVPERTRREVQVRLHGQASIPNWWQTPGANGLPFGYTCGNGRLDPLQGEQCDPGVPNQRQCSLTCKFL
jgi:hypothetical protein